MEFPKLLLNLSNSLGQDDLKALTFLCADLLPRNQNSVLSSTDLFKSLIDKDVLSAEEPQLLTELLITIHQPRLLRSLQLSDQVSTRHISAYRKLLYNLSEEITDEELENMKFLLNELMPRRKLADNTTLEVFLAMENMDLINETNLKHLEDIFKEVCPVLNKQIECYKALPAQETSRPRSLSLTSGSNRVHFQQQDPTMFVRSGSFGRPGVQPFSLLSQSSLNSSNSSDDVGQLRVLEPPLQNALHGLKQTDVETNSKSQDTKTAAETLIMFEGLDVYPMTAAKRGVCVILNNYNFSESNVTLRNRVGTNVDEESLQKVFKWLDFEVQIHRDLDKKNMLTKLQNLSREIHNQMDCLVCCVLSHGLEGNVYGVDGGLVSIKEDLMGPFDGLSCASLVEKPKLFFIQACQGNKNQRAVATDGTEEEDDDNISSDARVTESIPNGADFLLGMATVPNYVSFRDRVKGTWYIQSLCQNLTQMVPRGFDLVSILTKVNADVSKKSTGFGLKKQMPQPAFSLRKKVIFPVPSMPPPLLPLSSQSAD